MDRLQLNHLLEHELEHFPTGAEPHFHVVVATDSEDVWENPRFVASPPYREKALAEEDAADSRLVGKVSPGYQIEILDCARACPRSSLGHFGWEDEQPEPFHWWDLQRWR